MNNGYNLHDRNRWNDPYQPAPLDDEGHGTRMASFVAGRYSGVYKAARIVMIKVNEPGTGSIDAMVAICTFIAMITDVQERDIKGGVLLMSFGLYPGDLKSFVGDAGKDPFERLLAAAEACNIVVVMSAGNSEHLILTDRTPRMLAGAHKPHIVVGATMADGRRWTVPGEAGSTWRDPIGNDILSVYAIGDWTSAAGHRYDYEYMTTAGSSGAAAQVAGIAAFYMATLGKNAPEIKDYLIAQALALKGNGWPIDDPRFDVHPRVGLGQNMVPCSPTGPGPAPTAATLTTNPLPSLSSLSLSTIASYLTSRPEVSLYHGRPLDLANLTNDGIA